MPTIRKRGTRWQVQVRIKREGVIVYQESATFPTERLARQWGTALETKIEREGLQSRQNSRVTLSSLADAWLSHKRKVGRVSRGLTHSIDAVVAAPFSSVPLTHVTAADISEWAISLKDRLAPATVMHHISILRAMFNAAPSIVGLTLDDEPIRQATQHLQRLKVAARSESRDRRVSDAELEAIVKHLRSKFLTVPTDVYVQLAVELPRRREELLSMLWSDYNPQACTIVLRDTKNPRRPRNELIPIPAGAKAIIDALPRIDERILPYKPESVSAAFQRAVREIGLADVRLHDLRHEGISRLFEKGLDIHEVAMISGHTSWATLRRYTHLKPAHVLEKLNAGIKKTQKARTQPA